eukprot:gb/GFBE01065593.1/.p1 GENE.gb/GFBE01065593.1/~~gb/GFBE01065593.1/.p1  ORF type:complete len:771 (+),score=177.81 gb/GFBE01065593.1/:1-2313(+)
MPSLPPSLLRNAGRAHALRHQLRPLVLALAVLCLACWRSPLRSHEAHREWDAKLSAEDHVAFVPGPDRARLGLAARLPRLAAPEDASVAVATKERPTDHDHASGAHRESDGRQEFQRSEFAPIETAETVAEDPSNRQQPTDNSLLHTVRTVCTALLIGAAVGFAAGLWRPALGPTAKPVLEQAAAPLRSVAEKVSSSVPKVQVTKVQSPEDQVISADDKLAKVYSSLMDAARAGSTKLKNVVRSIQAVPGEKEPALRVEPGVVKKIRDIGDILDEAQSDVYKEEWKSLEVYPPILRAYIPLMTYYSDNAFPDDEGDKYVNAATRDSLQFEAKQFNIGISRLQDAIQARKVRGVEEAFAKTSLSYDRFLKAGDLYTGYDPVTSTTVFFRDISDSQLQYTPLALQQPTIRDEVLVLQGPDKGKVGRIIWLGRENSEDLNSKILTAVVKLEPNPVLGSSKNGVGVREVKAYPYGWVVMTRESGESYTQDLLLATVAAVVSCAVTFPLESIKARVQLNLPPIPPEGPQVLFRGVWLNVLREAPNAGFLMAGFNYLTRYAVGLPFVDGNNPNLKFALMIPAGVLAMCSGTFVKVPVIDISKQVQAGIAPDLNSAIENVYLKPSKSEVFKRLARTLMLAVIRGAPFGAFQCLIYEILKDKTPGLLESAGVPIAAEPFIWGGVAGFCTGYLTNPPDVVMQRLAVEASKSSSDGEDAPFSIQRTWEEIVEASEKVYKEDGWGGFAKGGFENAMYFAPEAMVWFGVYEALKGFTVSVQN